MPISEQSRINSYTGNGSTTVFAYTFKIFAEADLSVKVDSVTKTLTTDYTVSGVAAGGGGNVTFLTAPANGALVNISGEMAYKRDTDYVDNGDLRAQTLDDDLDRIVILEQQLRRDVKRAIKLPIEETDDKGILTVPASRVNKVFAFDDTGAPTVKAIADLSTTVTAVDASLTLSGSNLSVAKPTLTANAGGTVDAITATVSPAPAALTNGLSVLARATGANTSTTPTFNLNGLGAKTIVKGSNAALLAGDIPGAGYWMEVVYDSTLDKWVLQNPSNAITLVEHNSNGTHKTIGPMFCTIPTSDQSINSATITQITTWGDEKYDVGNVANTNGFTSPASAYYHFDAKVKMTGLTSGALFWCALYLNGSFYLYLEQKYMPSSGTAVIGGGANIYVPVGQVVDVRVYQDGGTTRTVDGLNGATYFSGHVLR